MPDAHPLERIPDPIEIRKQIGRNLQENRQLRQLLKLAEQRKQEHAKLTSASRQEAVSA